MSINLEIERVQACMEWLETNAENYDGQGSITWYIDQLGLLCKSMPFINGQMAEAKRILNAKKISAYESLAASSVANEQYFAPSLAKDYIGAKLLDDQYNYDLCERCSRTIVHTLEAVRTIISSLKEEMKIANYSGQT
jgi:hypothetical protein